MMTQMLILTPMKYVSSALHVQQENFTPLSWIQKYILFYTNPPANAITGHVLHAGFLNTMFYIGFPEEVWKCNLHFYLQ